MVLQVHRGDVVLVPTLTFNVTVEPLALLCLVSIIVDVDEKTLTVDPAQTSTGVAAAYNAGLRPVGVIAVDLYGHPAGYEGPNAAALMTNGGKLCIIANAAQSFGESVNGSRVGTLAYITITSFFPPKPLGCYGDGGAIFTRNAETASVLRFLRLHERDEKNKFDNVRIGMNSRSDTLKAAVPLRKLEF